MFKTRAQTQAAAALYCKRETLQKIFDNTWAGKSGAVLLNELLGFCRLVVKSILDNEYDLVVFMARKSWCFFKVLLPQLRLWNEITEEEEEKIWRHVTHDGMLVAYFNEFEKNTAQLCDTLDGRITVTPGNLRIAVVDDTCVMGTSLTRCIRRLVQCFGVTASNIVLYAFAVLDTKWLRHALPPDNRDKDSSGNRPDFRIRKNDDISYTSANPDDFHVVKWCARKESFINETDRNIVHTLSRRFVEAIVASAVPYTAFTPAFELTYEKAQEIFGDLDHRSIEMGLRLTQDKFHDRFRSANYEFYNMTSFPLQQRGIEAFVLFPKNKEAELGEGCEQWLPPSQDGYMEPLLRVYLNKDEDNVLVVPFVHIPNAEVHKYGTLHHAIPPQATVRLVPILESDLYYKNQRVANIADKDIIHEAPLFAYRVLSYTASYCLGQSFLEHACGLTKDDYKIEKNQQGLATQWLQTWVESDTSLVRETLSNAWSHFATDSASDTFVGDQKYIKSREIFQTYFDSTFSKDSHDSKVKQYSYYSEAAGFFRDLIVYNEEVRSRNAEAQVSGLFCAGGARKKHVFLGVLATDFMISLYEWMLSLPDIKIKECSANRVAATIVMLCDAGDASLHASMGAGGIIGGTLSGGEQSCFSGYNAEPSYAFCLQALYHAVRVDAISPAHARTVITRLLAALDKAYKLDDFRPVISRARMQKPLYKLDALMNKYIGMSFEERATQPRTFFEFNLPESEAYDGKRSLYQEMFSTASKDFFDFDRHVWAR